MAPTVTEVDPDAPEDFDSPALRLVDSEMRCSICREHYVAPMILTTCSHTFCCRCINTHLGQTRKCPQCSVETDEARLRKNITLAAAVTAWRGARPTLLQLQSAAASPHPDPPVASTSRGKGTSRPKARRSSTLGVEISSDSDIDITSRPPSRSYGTRSRTLTSTQDATANKGKGKGRAVVKVQDDHEKKLGEGDDASSDIEIIEVEQPKKETERRKRRMNSGDPSVLIAVCPICSGSYPTSELSTHAGGCVGNKKPTADAWSKLMGSATQPPAKAKTKTKSKWSETSTAPADTQPRLAAVNYNAMKQKALEQLLVASELPTTIPAGADKMTTWRRRHEQWRILWNSNLELKVGDPQRQTASQLRKELKAWEAAQDKGVKVDIGSSTVWAKTYKSQFDDLIRKAQPEPTRPPSPALHSSFTAAPDHFATDGDLSDSNDGSSSSGSSSRLLPPPPLSSSFVPLSRKRSRSSSPRSYSPFDPEGPKPSQRVREEIFIEEEDVFAEDSGPDVSLGAVMEDSAEDTDF